MIEREEIENTPNFEELLARFKDKMDRIPQECHLAMGALYIYQKIQEERKRQANRANQMSEGKRVFWSQVLPKEMLPPMVGIFEKAVEPLRKQEEEAELLLRTGFVWRKKDETKPDSPRYRLTLGQGLRDTAWYKEVAVPSAHGVGMSEDNGTLSAAKILWAFGSASRFPSFGCIVRYARLAPEDGKAPGRAKGKRIHYNPSAWQALYDLSEAWAKMPDCHWRMMWDAFKAQASQNHPDWPKWKIHAWGRRKMLREFLRELYDTWLAWEARQVA
jgi:hypothetical protein